MHLFWQAARTRPADRRQLKYRWAILVGIALTGLTGPCLAQAQEWAPNCRPSYGAPGNDFPSALKSRRIVILGSSTAAGVGASVLSRSWAGRLAQAAALSGLSVVNVSISGTNTQNSIDRFHRDVSPLNPDAVVLATNILNEGFAAGDGSAQFAAYVRNTRTLVEMIRSIDAKPILITMYPSNAYGPKQISLLRELHAAMETLGVPVWDFWGAVSDDQGHWLPGMSADGDHPTDLGHLHLYAGIPATQLTSLLTPPSAIDRPDGPHLRASSEGGGSLWLTLDQAAINWSIASWVQDSGSRGVYLASGEGLRFRLHRDGANVYFRQSDTVHLQMAAPPMLADGWTHWALTYQQAERTIRVYANGALLGEARVSADLSTTEFALAAGDCRNCAFAHAVLYRSPLPGEDVFRISQGLVLRRSLQIWAPLGAPGPSGERLNQAPTLQPVTVEGSWLPVADRNWKRCSQP